MDFKVGEVIKITKAEEEIGDYYEDGLLMCGICRKKKERMVSLFNRPPVKVSCLCDCQLSERDALDNRREQDEQLRYIQRLKIGSLMDAKYSEVKFTDCIETEANKGNLALCRRYVDTFKRCYEKNQGLIFYGGVGTGKSYSAACIANELLDQGVPVIMTSFVKMLEMIGKGGDAETQVMSLLNSAKLVVFDDFGTERSTDYALEKVYNIVDTRYRSGKPMIVTTNLELKDMISEVDIRLKRIYDRILEVCYPMHFTGASWRMKKANDRFHSMKDFLDGGN